MGDVTAWQAFATALGIMGPVGLTVVATAMVLGYVRVRFTPAVSAEQVTLQPERVTSWHIENRDAIRDTQKAMEEMSRRQERIIEVMDRIATAQMSCAEEQKRTAEILDRLMLSERGRRR